jgi:hypothetical protein
VQRSAAPTPTPPPALLSRWILGYRVILVVLLVALSDMAFKPGL